MHTKSAIRFDKLHTRSLKPRYAHLNNDEKKLVKLNEAIEQLTLEIDRGWRMAYRQGYHPQSNNNLALVETIGRLMTQRDRRQRQLAQWESRTALDADAILHKHRLLKSRGYGGSF